MTTSVKRCWEEARKLGAALAAHPERSGLAAELRELDQHFQLCASPEEEAIHLLLNGLVAAHNADAPWPSNGPDDND